LPGRATELYVENIRPNKNPMENLTKQPTKPKTKQLAKTINPPKSNNLPKQPKPTQPKSSQHINKNNNTLF
jgi:hypothetical protein